MRWALAPVIVMSACYSPTLSGGAPCEVGRDSCPTGQTCVAMGAGGVCRANGSTGVDSGTDIGHPDGATCLGAGLLGSICLMSAPSGPVTLSATINTAGVAATTGCTEMHPQAGGPTLCIIAGTTIDLPAAATVKAIGLLPSVGTVSGTNPLVLVATKSITIEGTLNLSAHNGETIGGTPDVGAGARTPTGCFAAGIDGQPGTQSNGGGGGAGGSFGVIGGLGGLGGNNNNTGRGNPVATAAPTVLIGGCPGGFGGADSGGGTSVGGVGGNAGGAVYLLAGESITIAGKINASGAGGGGGGNGNNASGGGGGGGAGGMIGLEAPQVTVTGSVFANGGGGGAGGGNAGGGDDVGGPGSDATAATTAASGGSGSNNGGNGGAGAFVSTAAATGKNGGGSFPQCAGGGGGGGTGVIRVFGVPAASGGGQISPPAH